MARFHDSGLEEVRERYCRIVDISGFTRLSLKEKPNLDCIFWSDGICTIYSARPLQCQSFPFWASNLLSEKAWESASLTCPGIGRGAAHPRREIEYWLKRRKNEQVIIIDEGSPVTL